jgi:hypothetical protein
MTLTSFKRSSLTNSVRYEDMLVGNAAFIPNSYESIATLNGTGASGLISFTSIPATYSHLQVRAVMLSSTSGNYVTTQFNSDTAANYSRHFLNGDGATATATGTASTNDIRGYGQQVGSSSTYPNVMILDILDYASTSKYKTTRMLSGIDQNGTGSMILSSGSWRSTSAINRIDFTLVTGSYSTTSTFALYGIKG